MERKMVIVLLIFVPYQSVHSKDSTPQKISCGANEYAVQCPQDCPADYCPTSESQNQTCPQQKCDQNAMGCKCAFNYRRAKNGTCIPTTDCPPFSSCDRPNEQYEACPPYCPSDSCADVKYNGQCPFEILLRLECFPKCQCKKGFARYNGTCVPTFLCPGLRVRVRLSSIRPTPH